MVVGDDVMFWLLCCVDVWNKREGGGGDCSVVSWAVGIGYSRSCTVGSKSFDLFLPVIVM